MKKLIIIFLCLCTLLACKKKEVNSPEPEEKPAARVVDIMCGDFHSVLLKEDGTLWATGRNTEGQLGLGDNKDRLVFTQVEISGKIKAIFAGGNQTFIIKEDNTVWATGSNKEGELGLGDHTNRNVFTKVILSDVVKIATTRGNNEMEYPQWHLPHTFFLLRNGTLLFSGKMYNNVKSNKPSPTGITNVKNMGAGMYYDLVLDNKNKLWARGRGTGMGFYQYQNLLETKVFTEVPFNASSITDIQIGFYYSGCFSLLFGAGELYYAYNGLIDVTGGNIFMNSFGQIPKPNPAIPITKVGYAGFYSAIVLKDGSLYTMGHFNNYGGWGREGNGSITYVMDDVVNVAAGEDHTFIIKSDGSLWGTGYNKFGQLGKGDTNNTFSFTKIPL